MDRTREGIYLGESQGLKVYLFQDPTYLHGSRRFWSDLGRYPEYHDGPVHGWVIGVEGYSLNVVRRAWASRLAAEHHGQNGVEAAEKAIARARANHSRWYHRCCREARWGYKVAQAAAQAYVRQERTNDYRSWPGKTAYRLMKTEAARKAYEEVISKKIELERLRQKARP